jgi:hypothetical protein
MTSKQYHERLARYTHALQNMESGEMVARQLVRIGVDCEAKDLWVLAHWLSGCAVEIVEPPKAAPRAAKPKTVRKRKPAAKISTDE